MDIVMAERRQLPPQIKRIELADRDGGRPVARYQLTVDVGVVDGKRKQLRKRYESEREARDALDAVRGDVAKGTYVHPSKVTLAEACQDWLAAKHGLKPSTLHGHRVNLAAALAELGDIEVQKLTKRHVDDLVTALRAGGLPSPTGKRRKPWSPLSVNYMLGLLTAVLRDQMRQGHVVRNVAELVNRVPADAKPADTFTPTELQRVLDHIEGDRYAIAWQLALTGLREAKWRVCGGVISTSPRGRPDLFDAAPVRQAPRRGDSEIAGGSADTADSRPYGRSAADRSGHPGRRSVSARRRL
jgi:integrase